MSGTNVKIIAGSKVVLDKLNEIKNTRIDQAKELKPIASGALPTIPASPADQDYKMYVSGGKSGATFTGPGLPGGSVSLTKTERGTLWFDKDTRSWELLDVQELPEVAGSAKVEPGRIPSGEAVLKYVEPLFEITDTLTENIDVSSVERTGIITTTGSISPSTNIDLSYTIPVSLGDILEYKGSLGNTIIAVAGYKSATLNPTNFVKSLLIGGIYESVQTIVIDDPEIKFIKASSRNASYPGNTNFLYLIKKVSRLGIAEDNINLLNNEVNYIIGNMVDPFIDENITPLKNNGRAINSRTGLLSDISSVGFPATEYCDYLKINHDLDYYVSGWFGDGVGVAGYDEDKIFNSRLADSTPSSINRVEYADEFKLTIPDEVHYIRGGTKDRNLYPFSLRTERRIEEVVKDNSEDLKFLLGRSNSNITISYVSNVKFSVDIFDSSINKTVSHQFIRSRQTNTFSGVTDVVTEDIWYPDSIYVEGNRIAQGNLNFIYRIDPSSYSNEDGTVGAGHGCVVAKWTKFLADGKSFDPTQPFADIKCSSFTISYYADCYAVDKSITTSGENALPQLDVDNNPIIANNHSLDATYYLDGRIEHRNRLHIRRDNTKFSRCYAGMNGCFRPYFDKVIFPNNTEFTINEHYVEGGSVIVNPIDDSTINSGTTVRFYSNEVTQLGAESYNYKLKNTIINMDSTKQKNANLLFYYASSPNWLKVYLQPVICTSNPSSNASLAEVFNNGDVIDILVRREVCIS